jgi:hypothetical protein
METDATGVAVSSTRGKVTRPANYGRRATLSVPSRHVTPTGTMTPPDAVRWRCYR